MLGILGDTIPFDTVKAVTDADELVSLIKSVSGVKVSEAVAAYIVRITDATRHSPDLKMGASPRGSRALYKAAKVWAAMSGRGYVTPEDVLDLVHPVLEHRLAMSSEAGFSGKTTSEILDGIIAGIEAPPSAADLLNQG